MYQVIQKFGNGQPVVHGPMTKQQLIESGIKSHWLPFIEKSSFKSITLTSSGPNNSEGSYTIKKIDATDTIQCHQHN